jgi:hypothetical protein
MKRVAKLGNEAVLAYKAHDSYRTKYVQFNTSNYILKSCIVYDKNIFNSTPLAWINVVFSTFFWNEM